MSGFRDAGRSLLYPLSSVANARQCDESRPSCGRCARKSLACSFTQEDSSLIILPYKPTDGPPVRDSGGDERRRPSPDNPAAVVRHARHNPRRDSAVLYASPRREIGAAERDRLILMSHYTAHTWETLPGLAANVARATAVAQGIVPRLAVQHSLIMHGLLSISSLHLALLQPESRQKHLFLATGHYLRGLVQFRGTVNNVTKNNVESLYAFACFLVVYSLGVHRVVPPANGPISGVAEVMLLLRGWSVVEASGRQWLMGTALGAIVMDAGEESTEQLPEGLDAALDLLGARSAGLPQSEVYEQCVQTLGMTFITAAMLPKPLALGIFAVQVDQGFFPLLEAREPMALAILGTYAVVLHWMRSNLWVDRWGERVLVAVDEALPEEWHDCIAWAKNIIMSPCPAPQGDGASSSGPMKLLE